jgi:hypothetical protein
MPLRYKDMLVTEVQANNMHAVYAQSTEFLVKMKLNLPNDHFSARI